MPLRQFCPDPFHENNSVRGFTAKRLTSTTRATTTTLTAAVATTTATTMRQFQNGEM